MNIFNIDDKGNKIVGNEPTIIDSNINFQGENNILYCDKNVWLNKSVLNFCGCNSLIYLGIGAHRVNISLWNDSVCHCGRGVYYNDTLKITLSEHKHCFIGDTCIISFNVLIRNSDPHLIYSCNDGNRINPTKSVYIGDHVWLGQNVTILKGSQIDSGSIIGANSVVAGKIIPHNSVWAGNPSRQIKDGAFWDETCVHEFTKEMTESSMNYHKFISESKGRRRDDDWIYEYDENQVIEWDFIESVFSHGTAMEKCSFLANLNSVTFKNRLVHK